MMKRRNWFRYFALVTAVVLVAISLCGVANAGVAVNLDGKLLAFKDQDPCIINGYTRVPIRMVVESLNGKADWDDQTQTATITKDSTIIKLKPGENKADVNGKAVSLNAPAIVINGRMMVPLRFIGENLGLKVDWDGATQTVKLSTPGYKEVAVASAGTIESGPEPVVQDKRKVLERIQAKVPGSEIVVDSLGILVLEISEEPIFSVSANTAFWDYVISIDSHTPVTRQYAEAALNEIDSQNASEILTIYGKVLNGEQSGSTFTIGGKKVNITNWAYHFEIAFYKKELYKKLESFTKRIE